MTVLLRNLFGFILNPLEKEDGDYQVHAMGRKILIIMGCLFTGLGAAVTTIIISLDDLDMGYLFPGVVFLLAGVFCLIVGCLGNDRAVAKVWGNR